MKFYTKIFIFLFFAFNLFSSESISSEPNYLPLAVGNEWTYKLDTGDEFKVKIANIEKINGLDFFVFESWQKGRIIQNKYFARDGDKILLAKIGVDFQKKIYKPAVIWLEYPVFKGKNWKQLVKQVSLEDKNTSEDDFLDISIADQEVIRVPAGRFPSYKVEYREKVLDMKMLVTLWLTDGIGLIKAVYSNLGSGQPVYMAGFELKKYRLKSKMNK